MQFGDTIQMQRHYDAGVGLVAGAEITVGTGEDEITPGLARALCGEAADGEGAYAIKVTDDESGEGKE